MRWTSLLLVAFLMADDPLDVTQTFDYLGRPQPLGRKSLSLAQSSGGGQVTAPVTPSVGQRATAAHEAAMNLVNRGLDPIGLSKAGLQFAEDALRLFPSGETVPAAAAPSGQRAPDFPLAEGQPTQFPTGSTGLTPADAAIAAEAEHGSTASGVAGATSGSAPSVVGATGQVLPYLGGALQLAQDLASSQDDRTKAINAAIDAAALAGAPFTGGASVAAAPFAKADVAREADPSKPLAEKIIAYPSSPAAIAADLVSLFGGPDILEPIFGTSGPSHFEQVRKAAAEGGAQAEGALGSVYAGATDPASLYSALGSRAADRGSVRSYLNLPAEAATQLGLPEGGVQWSQLSPKQFMDVLRWFRDDPSRLQHVSGSGDVGYLPGDQAQALGGQTAEAARSAISRIIAGGLPEATPPLAMPEAPSAAGGPEGSLGFARSLIENE